MDEALVGERGVTSVPKQIPQGAGISRRDDDIEVCWLPITGALISHDSACHGPSHDTFALGQAAPEMF